MELNQEFWVTALFTVINIIVLYIILKKLLFKPVSKHMDDRSKKIQEALDLAEEAKRKVDDMKKEYDAKLRIAKDEGDKIVEDYKRRADKEYEKALETAKREAEQMIQKTRLELEVEKKQLISEVKKEMSELVLAASQKVLKENLDTDANRKLISEFIEKESISK